MGEVKRASKTAVQIYLRVLGREAETKMAKSRMRDETGETDRKEEFFIYYLNTILDSSCDFKTRKAHNFTLCNAQLWV